MGQRKDDANSLTRKLFLEKLASSGLDESDAAQLGMLFAPDGGSLHPQARGLPAMVINYADAESGRPTGFYRVRLLAAPRGFAAERPRRYLQPAGTGPAAYFPRTVDWKAVLADPTVPVYVTEGELKAACAAKHGLACVGLGGVSSWRSARMGVALLPELDAVPWRERHVFVVFDSDASTNHQVMAALRGLCAELSQRGALPFVAKLPDVPGLDKTGLDDLVVARGPDALRPVFESAEAYGPAEELWKLNDRACFVRDPGFVVELATGCRMSVQSFSKEVYANLFYVERVEGPKGPRLERRQTAAEWVRWPHRLETRRLTYAPGQARFTAAGELNTWTGSGVEPAPGDCGPWERLLAHLFGDERGGAAWFERWCAYPLRHPGTKLGTAVALWGVHQGTGKSLVGYTLAKLYGDHNFSEINQEHLRSPYNDWLVDKQLVMGDEISGSDRRADSDRLKSMITGRQVRVSSKYVREYTVPAVANFFFTSNHPDAFFLEDTDRRFFVHEVVAPPLPESFYVGEYDPWYRSAAGQAALLDRLLRLDLSGFSPDGPALETASKREMIEDNKSDLAAWVLRLRREPEQLLRECGMPPDAPLLTAAQLLAMYDPSGSKRVTANGMGRELKRSRVPRLGTVNVANGHGRTTYRMYALRDAERWLRAPTQAAAAEWLRHFGGGK